jgi:putative FmdB family regulatory protein
MKLQSNTSPANGFADWENEPFTCNYQAVSTPTLHGREPARIIQTRDPFARRSNWKLMPIYEFECQKCKAHTEVFQKMNEKQPTKCDKCGGRLEKLVSASAIQFKGSGWYVTDYAGNGRKAAEKAESEASGTSETKEAKKSDKKSKDNSPSKKASEKTPSTKI